MAEDQSSSDATASLLKAGLIGLGGFVAVTMLYAILKPLLILGVIGGAGYLGYRLFMGSDKAIEGTKERKALSPNDDFERKMRELEAMERKLDAEIRKNS